MHQSSINNHQSSIREAGFTLIELMVTIILISIIASITLGVAAGAKRNAEDAQRRSDLSRIQSALQQFYTDQGHYPLCLAPDVLTELNNCTGNVADSGYPPDRHNCTNGHPGTCVVSHVYLTNFPRDPHDNGSTIHYCYAAYSQYVDNTFSTIGSATGNGSHLCDPFGGSALDPSACQYFKLYAPQSNEDLHVVTCHDHRGDHLLMRYALDPLGNN